MRFLLRPHQSLGVALALAVATMPIAQAQIAQVKQLLRDVNPLMSHSNAQGYLGVMYTDVDNESVGKLKLKDGHGAIITLIDHDAPAAQMGIRVNDVIVQFNNVAVENAEQLKRLLHDVPPGRKVSLAISREGNQQTITVQLADQKKMEHEVWTKMNSADVLPPPSSGMGMLTGGGDAPIPPFRFPSFGNSLNVGAIVEPLTSQMADYLGLPNGVMVKQVTRKSEAHIAGMKAFDVILKVGNESINTTADWDRALRANAGKSVQVAILRDRRQQTLNLQVDSKRK